MSTLFLRLPASHIGRCTETIARRLSAITGIHRVHVDRPTHLVEVRFDRTLTSAEQVRHILAEAPQPGTITVPDHCDPNERLAPIRQ